MLIHFIHGYYCIYRPWQPLTYLYFPYHCISLIYFSFTKIRMFLYARIYWLVEFGDVSCLQFNYRSESGDSHSHSDLGGFCRTILRVKSDETLCSTWEYDRWYTWRDLYYRFWHERGQNGTGKFQNLNFQIFHLIIMWIFCKIFSCNGFWWTIDFSNFVSKKGLKDHNSEISHIQTYKKCITRYSTVGDILW